MRLDQLRLLWMVVVPPLMKSWLLFAAWARTLLPLGLAYSRNNQWSREYCCICHSVSHPLALRWHRRSAVKEVGCVPMPLFSLLLQGFLLVCLLVLAVVVVVALAVVVCHVW